MRGGFRTQCGGVPHEACLKSIWLKEKHTFSKSLNFEDRFGFAGLTGRGGRKLPSTAVINFGADPIAGGARCVKSL